MKRKWLNYVAHDQIGSFCVAGWGKVRDTIQHQRNGMVSAASRRGGASVLGKGVAACVNHRSAGGNGQGGLGETPPHGRARRGGRRGPGSGGHVTPPPRRGAMLGEKHKPITDHRWPKKIRAKFGKQNGGKWTSEWVRSLEILFSPPINYRSWSSNIPGTGANMCRFPKQYHKSRNHMYSSAGKTNPTTGAEMGPKIKYRLLETTYSNQNGI